MPTPILHCLLKADGVLHLKKGSKKCQVWPEPWWAEDLLFLSFFKNLICIKYIHLYDIQVYIHFS